MARQEFVQIKGAYPALDRKKLDQPFILDGKNYLVDLDGPKSAFGFECIYDKFLPSHLMQSFVVGAEIFYFARDVGETYVQISTLDWLNKQVIPVLKWNIPDPTRPKLRLPWTHALVGTYHYFANRTWGVIRYDPINRNWEDVTATIGISNIFFLTEAGGRLCTLAEGVATWSAIDNGMDNTPAIATGAGFQALSLVGTLEQNRDYLGIQKTAKGFISFTSKGILRSELVDSVNPFRHIPGEAQQKPLNPWCITKISDTEILILSKQGLFTSTDGFKFQEFQPIMGEYFKTTEIPPLEKLENGFISTYYSVARDELYISFAQSEIEGQYNKAWVLYLPINEWGSFDHIHKNFVFIDALNLGTSFHQAYICQEGKINYLNDRSITLISEAQSVYGIYVQATLIYPTHQEEGVNIMPTNVRCGGFSIIGYPEIAGWYEEFGVFETYFTDYSTLIWDVSVNTHWFSDLSLTQQGDALTLTTPILFNSGTTYNVDFNVRAQFTTGTCAFFIKHSSITTHVTLIEWTMGTTSFNKFGVLASFVDVAIIDRDNHDYTIRATIVGSSTITDTREIRIRPAYSANSELGSFGLQSLSIYDILNSVELVPSPLTWTLSGGLIEFVGERLPASAKTKSSLIVLDKTAQLLTQKSLNSQIEVGLFRFTDDAVNDQLSAISNVAVSCLDITDSTGDTFEDWLEDYPTDVFEDWLAIVPDEFEDWGESSISGSVYTQKIRGTLDGYKTFEDQYVDIDEVLIEGKTKFMSCDNAGIFQSIEISALSVGSSYHIKTLEINGTLMGRL